jgi:hypothetical protein
MVAGGSKSWPRSGFAPIFTEGWSASPLRGEGSAAPTSGKAEGVRLLRGVNLEEMDP